MENCIGIIKRMPIVESCFANISRNDHDEVFICCFHEPNFYMCLIHFLNK